MVLNKVFFQGKQGTIKVATYKVHNKTTLFGTQGLIGSGKNRTFGKAGTQGTGLQLVQARYYWIQGKIRYK